MARDIVIFCDGTGNQFGDTNSNVLKLHDCLHRDAAEVLTFYDPGVGTFGLQEAMFAWQQVIPRLAGLAFGWGYRQMVHRAYTFIACNYQPGDRVWLFGFSRGAYIARVLAGMLHGTGLLEPGNVHLFDSAFRLYKKAFRRDEEGGFPILQRFKKQFCRPCPVHFLGVFDTVKSIGWFRRWMVLPWTAKNESVGIFRHALSIDERRCFFRPNLWGDPGKTDVREVWFAGVHADVGGGYLEAEAGLSKIVLKWMIDQAQLAGLRMDAKRMARIMGGGGRYVKPDHVAEAHRSLKSGWWLPEVLLPRRLADRQGCAARTGLPFISWSLIRLPRHIGAKSDIHVSVQQRMEARPDYRPANLPKAPKFVDL